MKAPSRHDTRALARSVLAAVLALAVELGGSGPVAAAEEADWPCVQRKVPELSAGMVWAGPPIEQARAGWQDDEALARLAHAVAARRTTADEARAMIGRFADTLGPDKDRRLTRLFAAVFELINEERNVVVAGIERYARKQRALAEQIQREADELEALRDLEATAETRARTERLEEQVHWDTRVFQEREQALSYVCETPVLLEQRLFALAREIAALLD